MCMREGCCVSACVCVFLHVSEGVHIHVSKRVHRWLVVSRYIQRVVSNLYVLIKTD